MTLPDPASGPVLARGDDDLQHFGYRQELRRSLTFTDLLVYGLIFMVPIAPFGIFGSVFQASGGMVALAYIVGAVAMAFSFAGVFIGQAVRSRMPAETFRRWFLIAMILLGVYLAGSALAKQFA